MKTLNQLIDELCGLRAKVSGETRVMKTNMYYGDEDVEYVRIESDAQIPLDCENPGIETIIIIS